MTAETADTEFPLPIATSEYTTEDIAEAARQLVAIADSNAQITAQSKKLGGKGFATASYPNEIPELDKLAVQQLQREGHIVSMSKRRFLNSVSFPDRVVFVAGR